MELINVMISSTIQDLIGDRDAINSALLKLGIVKLFGASPIGTPSRGTPSRPGSSRLVTVDMARDCDLLVLILGNRYGYETASGKSATELEFDAAFKDDPTKILVFQKTGIGPADTLQQQFIDRVCNYSSGYWRSTFEYSHQLQDLAVDAFSLWLRDRAALGRRLDYLDHFVRLAKQRLPEANAKVYYRVAEDYVELEYVVFGISHTAHFERRIIYTDFWGCLSNLEMSIAARCIPPMFTLV